VKSEASVAESQPTILLVDDDSFMLDLQSRLLALHHGNMDTGSAAFKNGAERARLNGRGGLGGFAQPIVTPGTKR
jgi:hypothetical protein